MIRDVKPQDATAITKIYNEYITNSIISFETEPLTEEDMLSRIVQISSKYPYLVYETGGIVVGYCYAHAWKERAAYRALIACITDDNIASKSLHIRLGFKQVSHFKKVGLKFDRWLDVVDYELLLTP